MIDLSPVITANIPAVRPVEPTAVTVQQNTDTHAARASAVVSLGNAVADTMSQTYSNRGVMPGQEVVPVWEGDRRDALSQRINTQSNASSMGNRFNGLGVELIHQFAASGAGISQSMLYGNADDIGEIKTRQGLLHNQADNLINLSIKTASGKTVTFSLSSQGTGLGVQARVDGGALSDDELAAVGKLGEAFQAAVDGLTASPPKLNLSGLTRFDSHALASVDLSASLKSAFGEDLKLAFHADRQSRATRLSGPEGELNLAVDLKNTAILGNASQQARALQSYLAQFDRVEDRGGAKAQLMSLFKDAFSAMNSNYPQSDVAPDALTRHASDQGLLTGLADFRASIQQVNESSNPLRQSEVDSFAYNLSQTTRVDGSSALDRDIRQEQQSNLAASFHKSLNGGQPPVLGMDAESQNYLYIQVEDKARTSTHLSYKDGLLANAAVEQSASQHTRMQKYVMGRLLEDTVVPKEAASKRDYVTLLEYAARESRRAGDALQESTLKDALEAMHDSVILQDDPVVLVR